MSIIKYNYSQLKDTNKIEHQKRDISELEDIPLQISFVLAETKETIKNLNYFQKGTIIKTGKQAQQSVDIMIGDKFISKGEVRVDQDGEFVVKII